MSVLADILQKVKSHGRFVEEQVQRARQEPDFRKEVLKKFESLRAAAGTVVTPTGLKLPRLALPQTDDPGEIARYLFGEGAPGEFPFVHSAYREMYFHSESENTNQKSEMEEPTRLFAGLGLAEDTNKRFHMLTKYQKTIRLSTAFDGPTLYGLDSDAGGVLDRIGEGGVAGGTVEDMERLYAGVPLG